MSSKDISLDELKDLQKQLSKLATSSDSDAILSIFGKLKSGLSTPTEDIIRQSKIGVAVGKMRSHSDKKVADQAKSLVKDWKATVDKQRAQQQSSANSSKAPSSTASPAPAGTKAEGATNGSGTAESPSSSTPAAAAAKGASSNTKIDFEILNDKVRNACLKLLYNSLEIGKDAHGWSDSQIFDAAVAVEAAILANQGKGAVTTEYRNKVRSLSLNIKDKNNPDLRARVVERDIPADTLVTMSNEELASDKRKREIEQLQMQNLFKAKGAAAQEAETDAFQCGRCKQRKTRYYQMQTRSADEPMTTFVTCTNCNHKWKFC
ncbi:related to transcription elongation factor TFIIS [Sporisorium reilianum SRZ2]|uniref:Transcription elongation factor n=2 Tax=Sporisorium reilianum TaxID=72558 RepID=E6ZUM0_SPORE|nr:related to transcription elongation factor TFIIS [Sporisorium reilianum SRZ2]SJX65952.1 related to transcription elongation factor TFIIS [Sporisorium reilianum f. sp. reilianum]